MKQLTIQLHHDRIHPSVMPIAIYGFEAALRRRQDLKVVHTETGDENGAYTNILVEADVAALAWGPVRAQLEHLNLLGAAIVVCQGADGWNDYVLLHDLPTA